MSLSPTVSVSHSLFLSASLHPSPPSCLSLNKLLKKMCFQLGTEGKRRTLKLQTLREMSWIKGHLNIIKYTFQTRLVRPNVN